MRTCTLLINYTRKNNIVCVNNVTLFYNYARKYIEINSACTTYKTYEDAYDTIIKLANYEGFTPIYHKDGMRKQKIFWCCSNNHLTSKNPRII